MNNFTLVITLKLLILPAYLNCWNKAVMKMNFRPMLRNLLFMNTLLYWDGCHKIYDGIRILFNDKIKARINCKIIMKKMPGFLSHCRLTINFNVRISVYIPSQYGYIPQLFPTLTYCCRRVWSATSSETTTSFIAHYESLMTQEMSSPRS